MNIKFIISVTFLLLIIILTIVKYFVNKKKKHEFFLTQNKINYIFWTGGYDSTFRLCQLLIDEKKIVQPIYISAIIDNEEDKNTRRHNHKFEYAAMKKIREELNKNYPYIKETLLPLIDIKKITIDYDIKENMKILKQQQRVRRATCQYGGLAQVARNIMKRKGEKVEICVEKEPHGSMMYNTLYGKVDCEKNDCYLKKDLNRDDSSLKIFNDLKFTTLHLSKKDMLDISKKNRYNKILGMTWSCWYPKNNLPCGRCIMCRERII